jgi:hypothetical protein
MGVGRNLSYRRELFFKYKGFSSHNHIPGGDDDLFINAAAHRGNTAIMIDPESFTLSRPKTTFRAWMRQKYRHYSTGKHYQPLHKWLLGTYSLTHFLFYPLLIAAAILGFFQIALGILGFRMIVLGIIYHKSMSKLGERDLWIWFPLLDLWMFLYYLIFIPTLWKRPKQSWN